MGDYKSSVRHFLDASNARRVTDLQHWDAWNVACNHRAESNLARCYIDAVETLRKVQRIYGQETGDGAEGDTMREVRRIVSNAPPSYESDAGEKQA